MKQATNSVTKTLGFTEDPPLEFFLREFIQLVLLSLLDNSITSNNVFSDEDVHQRIRLFPSCFHDKVVYIMSITQHPLNALMSRTSPLRLSVLTVFSPRKNTFIPLTMLTLNWQRPLASVWITIVTVVSAWVGGSTKWVNDKGDCDCFLLLSYLTLPLTLI